MLEPVRIIGLDLGQQRDYTAISVTERTLVSTGERYEDYVYNHKDKIYGYGLDRRRVELFERVDAEYHVRHLERPPLGTPYPEVVERVLELIKHLGGYSNLVVDATGCGRPVVDMLRQRHIEGLNGTDVKVRPCWIQITAGADVTKSADSGFLNVPKRDLISAALVLLQRGRLRIAESLALKDALVKELLAFRVKINISTAHDSYEAWREGDHDDLVLSVALACWAGERFLRKVDSEPALPHALRTG
jgi:hypothetical protein